MAKRSEREDLRAILSELRRIRKAAEDRPPRRHVWPLAETDHILRGEECWCSPGVGLADDFETEIVVHQRMN